MGASRTDSGAHARGQVCHFDSSVGIEESDWTRALNKILPPDLGILSSKRVAGEFHSRFSATDRRYTFTILTAGRNPLKARFAYHYGRAVDVDKMRAAAKSLEGVHDYRAFCEALEGTTNTVRRVLRVNVTQAGDEVRIEVLGQAFLRGMMRRISGALLEIGRAKRPVEDVGTLLSERRDILQWPVVLPARGLILMEVRYGRHPKDNRTKNLDLEIEAIDRNNHE